MEVVEMVLPFDEAAVLISGYTDDAAAVHGNFWAGIPLLQKPFTPSALAERVRLALDASAGATDFGEYFTYFSFFLVVSALMLAVLFFRLGIEQRLRQMGILRAAGYEVVEIDPDGLCCGAAGLYSVARPDTSHELGERKATQIRAVGVDLVASANPGCEIQLRSHLGDAIRVAHPIEIYADATRTGGFIVGQLHRRWWRPGFARRR